MTPPAAGAVLHVKDLAVRFTTPEGTVQAVNGVSFSVAAGETLAILGESGCGKSVTVQAVMGLVRSPPGEVRAAAIRFRDLDLLSATPRELRAIRGPRIAMIFQDPFMSLDPGKTVGQQIGEMFRVHRRARRTEARRHSIELMERVRIPSARDRVDHYPHQFSGGMSQRVMIASAIALGPELLIADEPTTALDVTVQAQIMALLAGLRSETGMAMVLITHDVGLAAETAGRAAVMYAGRFVETGPMAAIHDHPAHPYTRGLLRSIPSIDRKSGRLHPIEGAPPRLTQLPPGCAFAPRCPHRRARCTVEVPPLRPFAATHAVACHFAEEIVA
ncbi:ABC transporter ATP-binding protein [Elioraea sp.]|uniref:ABC transporter ATP-binding protein n=1 Tax=Elioraea sp. TaxID=2185103 RepID=UPI003F705D20